MAVIGQVLVQFVFRITFGMALAMGVTPPRLVESGYFRIHLWVLLGFNTLATLAVVSGRHEPSGIGGWSLLCGLAVGLALLSYIGAILWLYEKPQAGRLLLAVIGGVAAVASVLALPASRGLAIDVLFIGACDSLSGGWLLGTTLAAMLLGHWYLNTPSMQLAPLRRLILLLAAAAVARGLVSAVGLTLQDASATANVRLFYTFLAFRWLTGILGILILARLAWQTLKIPNTQSATGILYAGVILVFLGELIAQLLSINARYPL